MTNTSRTPLPPVFRRTIRQQFEAEDENVFDDIGAGSFSEGESMVSLHPPDGIEQAFEEEYNIPAPTQKTVTMYEGIQCLLSLTILHP